MRIPKSYMKELRQMYNIGKGFEIDQYRFSDGKLSVSEYLQKLENAKRNLDSVQLRHQYFKNWARKLKLEIREEIKKLQR